MTDSPTELPPRHTLDLGETDILLHQENNRQTARSRSNYLAFAIVGVASVALITNYETLQKIVEPYFQSRTIQIAQKNSQRKTNIANRTVVSEPASPLHESIKSTAVRALTDYLERLKDGRAIFSLDMSGEEAARQLNATRLFASSYEELKYLAKARRQKTGRLHIKEIIDDYERITSEEVKIDTLRQKQDATRIAVAYLRALQNGDVTFPGPANTAPAPPILLAQLARSYPALTVDFDDPLFARVYRITRQLVAERFKSNGSVEVHFIVAAYRYCLLKESTS